MKVLLHINDPVRWPMVIVNAVNFIKDVGIENAELEVIANADAVSGYLTPADDDLLTKMSALAEDGAKFVACRNTLNALKIDAATLPGFVKVAPAAVTEIAIKQAADFAYIKP